MAYLNLAILSDDHELKGGILKIDNRAADDIADAITRSKELMPGEVVSLLGLAISRISTLEFITGDEMRAVLGQAPEPVVASEQEEPPIPPAPEIETIPPKEPDPPEDNPAPAPEEGTAG